jgi:hypothetical protein
LKGSLDGVEVTEQIRKPVTVHVLSARNSSGFAASSPQTVPP